MDVYQLALFFIQEIEPRLRWGRVLDRGGQALTTLDMLLAAIAAGRWPVDEG